MEEDEGKWVEADGCSSVNLATYFSSLPFVRLPIYSSMIRLSVLPCVHPCLRPSVRRTIQMRPSLLIKTAYRFSLLNHPPLPTYLVPTPLLILVPTLPLSSTYLPTHPSTSVPTYPYERGPLPIAHSTPLLYLAI